MSWIKEWFNKSLSITKNPKKFFENLYAANSSTYAIKFAATSGAFAAVVSYVILAIMLLAMGTIIGTAIFGLGLPIIIIFLILMPIFYVILYILSVLLQSFLVHIFVLIFGGSDFKKTLEALSYPTGIMALTLWLSFIPVIGPIIGLVITAWVTYADVMGIKGFHQISTVKALLAVVLPLVIMIALIMLLLFIPFFYGEFSTPGLNTGPPPEIEALRTTILKI